MKVKDFIGEVSSKPIVKNKQYCLCGNSVLQREDLVKKLKLEVSGLESFNLEDEGAWGNIQKGSLWGGRIILVRGVNDFTRIKGLIKLVENPVVGNTIIWIVDDEKIDKLVKKVLEDNCETVVLEKPKNNKNWEVWLKDQALKLGLDLNVSVIKEIMSETEDDEYERRSILYKLVLYADVIQDAQKVKSLLAKEEKIAGWELQNSILAGNWVKARRVIKEYDEEPLIVSILGNTCCKIWLVTLLKQQKLDDKKISEILGIRGYAYRGFKNVDKKISSARIRNLLLRISELDRRYKKGLLEYSWKEELLGFVFNFIVGD